MAEASPAAHDYDVAISYAGEDRLYVDDFVECLKARGVDVFYDLDEEATLWGADLPEVLLDIFQKKARTAVVFISEHYVKKPWAMFEGRTVIGRTITEHGTYLLPVRIDDTELPGLRPEIVYQTTAAKSPSELVSRVISSLTVRGAGGMMGACRHPRLPSVMRIARSWSRGRGRRRSRQVVVSVR